MKKTILTTALFAVFLMVMTPVISAIETGTIADLDTRNKEITEKLTGNPAIDVLLLMLLGSIGLTVIIAKLVFLYVSNQNGC